MALSLVIRKLDLLYLIALLAGFLPAGGCDKFASPSSEAVAQRQEELRIQEKKERAATVEQMKAATLAQDQKQEPIRNLQKQIDALDEQISDARSKGKDCRALEKTQDALEAQKYELQRQ